MKKEDIQEELKTIVSRYICDENSNKTAELCENEMTELLSPLLKNGDTYSFKIRLIRDVKDGRTKFTPQVLIKITEASHLES